MSMLSNPSTRRRPPYYTTQSLLSELYSDARKHGYQGPSRTVRMQRVTSSGGGTISKSEDGQRCAVAGKESLRIVRMSDPLEMANADHKSSVGRGGHRVDASRNFWDGSGLKIDSASTDVAWCTGLFNNKVLTSAKNGEIIVWDLQKAGSTKYERRSKDHIRSINKLSCSPAPHSYCLTASADGDVRVWDLRDMSKSIMRIHHPAPVRTVVFSPSSNYPLQAVTGLDNGSIYRWDLKMGQRGQLDRIPVAHSGSVLGLDWCDVRSALTSQSTSESTRKNPTQGDWIVTGGLDHTVKVWDLNAVSGAHISRKPTYTLHPAFPVRRVIWRPDYPCELAVVSNADLGIGSNPDISHGVLASASAMPSPRIGTLDVPSGIGINEYQNSMQSKTTAGDLVEIWDVRRGYIAKWTVEASVLEGSVTDVAFHDSHSLWAQHYSGTFAQIDLRHSFKPIDAIPRTSLAWDTNGSLAFVADKKTRFELPYDDIDHDNTHVSLDLKSKLKTLGDASSMPRRQSLGTFASEQCMQELETFTKLAHSYVFDGDDRQSICAKNAETALQAEQPEAAQIWLVLGALLEDVIPSSFGLPKSLPIKNNPFLSHSVSAPAAIPSVNISAGAFSGQLGRGSSSDSRLRSTSRTRTSPGRGSHKSSDSSVFRPPSTSRNATPASSAHSSPHRSPNALPPVSSSQLSPFTRLDSSSTPSSRRPSVFNRPPITAFTTLSPSGSSIESPKSYGSLRHVGEGALDDSDSSPESDDELGMDDNGISADDSAEGSAPSMVSSQLMNRVAPANPSPLSRVVEQGLWEDDGDDREDGASPSPASTDSEFSDSEASPTKANNLRSSRRGSAYLKARSRSSTVASLAGASSNKFLKRQQSHSSLQTVIAGRLSSREKDDDGTGKEDVRPDDQNRRSGKAPPLSKSQSQTLSGHFAPAHHSAGDDNEESTHGNKLVNRRIQDQIRAREESLRDATWKALREMLDQLAANGDVQMCAMLAIVACQELRISESRVARFVEAYTEILTRLRMHTCAAYVRKHAPVEFLRAETKLETTFHTMCGRCRKPFTGFKKMQRGAFSFCQTCRRSTNCAICRMPVKTLLFRCSICSHGGHQECYVRFYMTRPMVELAAPTVEDRGRPSVRHGFLMHLEGQEGREKGIPVTASAKPPADSARQSRLAGHPCAAGCGHFCWAIARNDS